MSENFLPTSARSYNPAEQDILQDIIDYNEEAGIYDEYLNEAWIECQNTLNLLESEGEKIANLSEQISYVAESIENSRANLAESCNQNMNLLSDVSPPSLPFIDQDKGYGTYPVEWYSPSPEFYIRRRPPYRRLGPEDFVTPAPRPSRRKVRILPRAPELPEDLQGTYKQRNPKGQAPFETEKSRWPERRPYCRRRLRFSDSSLQEEDLDSSRSPTRGEFYNYDFLTSTPQSGRA